MWYIILFFATLCLDQVTKIIFDALDTHVTLIEGVLNINITYNRGASFSFLADKPWAQTFFICLTFVVLAGGCVYLVLRKKRTRWLDSSLALLFSGTIGNLIDRIAFGYVTDMFRKFQHCRFLPVHRRCDVACLPFVYGRRGAFRQKEACEESSRNYRRRKFDRRSGGASRRE